MKNDMKPIMEALRKLKSEISIVDGGIKVHVYPIPDITLTDSDKEV